MKFSILVLLSTLLPSSTYIITAPPPANFATTTTNLRATNTYALGIDLGTSHSCCSILQDKESAADPSLPLPIMVPLPNNQLTVPSTITVTSSGYVTVGTPAAPAETGATFRSLKRILARGYKWLCHPVDSGGVSVVAPPRSHKKYRNTGYFERTVRLLNAVPGIAPRSVDDEPDEPAWKSKRTIAKGRAPLKLERIEEDYMSSPIRMNLPTGNVTSPQHLSSYVITYLLAASHAHLLATTGQSMKCDRVVCAVPAYFEEERRDVTTDIVTEGLRRWEKIRSGGGTVAEEGFRIDDDGDDLNTFCTDAKVKILAEPEAASLAYSVLSAAPSNKQTAAVAANEAESKKGDDMILVFDLGGGTFDTTILAASKTSTGRYGTIEVISSSGDANLGGNDLDAVIFKEVIEKEGCGKLTEESPEAKAAALVLSEAIRIQLSAYKKVELYLPKDAATWEEIAKEENRSISILTTMPAWDHVQFTYTRDAFEDNVLPLLNRLLRPVREVAISADVLLVGDSSPRAASDLMAEMGAAGLDGDSGDDDDDGEGWGSLEDTVARLKAEQKGARKRSRNLANSQAAYKSTKLQLGGNVKDMPGRKLLANVVLVGGVTKTPVISKILTTLTGIRPKLLKGLSPDHAVSLGAAVQAGVFDGSYEDEDNPEGGLGVMSPMQAALMRMLAKDYHDEQNKLKAK
jgi:molecular chaperone DnaK (HSP70)